VVAITGDFVTLSPAYILGGRGSERSVSCGPGWVCLRSSAIMTFMLTRRKVTRALEAQRISRPPEFPLCVAAGAATLWIIGVDDIWWQAADLPAACSMFHPRYQDFAVPQP